MTPREYYESIKHVLPEYHRGVIDCHLRLQEMVYFEHEAESVIEDDTVLHNVLVRFVGGGYAHEQFTLTPECRMVGYSSRGDGTPVLTWEDR